MVFREREGSSSGRKERAFLDCLLFVSLCTGGAERKEAGRKRIGKNRSSPFFSPVHPSTSKKNCSKPCAEEEYVTSDSSPQQCRLRDMTYAAPVTVDVEYTRGRELVVRRGRTPGTGALLIGRLPIMLRSDRCVLRGRSDAELAALRECPLDPGGYFVVRGAEKVVLIQEQLSKNRVLVDRDANGAPTASVTSSTAERKSKTSIVLRGGRPCVRHNAFADDVSAVVVMRAMGAESVRGGKRENFFSLSPSLVRNSLVEREGTKDRSTPFQKWNGKKNRTRRSCSSWARSRPCFLCCCLP